MSLAKSILEEIHRDAKERKLVDPWKRQYEWYKHPFFSRSEKIKRMFPGLGIAAAAFAVYCAAEVILDNKH